VEEMYSVGGVLVLKICSSCSSGFPIARGLFTYT
jgi:hypothetical protein